MAMTVSTIIPSKRVGRVIRLVVILSVVFAAPLAVEAQATRLLVPSDMFAIEEAGPSAWSPDGSALSVQLLHSDRWLDWSFPASDLRVLDVATGRWQAIGARRGQYVGFFGAAWSPSGKNLLFLSIDSNAIVRPWIWARGKHAPRLLGGLRISDSPIDGPAGLWSDDTHLIFLTRDSTTPNSGPLYAELFAHRNAADRWRTAYEGVAPSVAVIQSRGPDTVISPRRLVSVDISSGALTGLASGELHHPSLSIDRRTLTYWRQRPALGARIDTTLFGAGDGEPDYLRVDWGNELHAIDLRTGMEIAAPHDSAPASRDSRRLQPPAAPRFDARLKATSPNGSAALYAASADGDGSHLWLVRSAAPAIEVWRGNAWVREVRAGSSERVTYSDSAGHTLTGWVLYPPGHRSGERLPVVTIIYPGTVYTSRVPTEFFLLYRSFENPQLFAALGYAVVLPSIPYPDKPMEGDMIAPLAAAVMPLIDTLVARGIADPDRIALLGQSAGGYAVQAMITQTDRFRTAISTAGYSDLISLYGTFYGQYRHGDAGDPQASTALRMMQIERGYDHAGAPPWAALERYIANSPIFRVARVHTPLMIVQGENDFVPVQQSEEYFSALYRQYKRAEFVRYYGEAHTITRQANVLDFWRRIDVWLRETMQPR
jgi:acetyl esterase/lipase